MKQRFRTLALCLAAVLAVQAYGWDEGQYREIEQSIRVPAFAAQDFPITKYGAKVSNTAAKNQKAIQKAIDTCAKKGGGRVVVPAGQHFLTGAIALKSHVNLVVEEGAVLEFAF
jgi:polygalacturonase